MTSANAESGLRKFRFAAGGEGNRDEGGARKFVKLAQKAEEYGFDTFAMPDHLGNQVGPLAALGALSQATDKIRLATSVLANGYPPSGSAGQGGHDHRRAVQGSSRTGHRRGLDEGRVRQGRDRVRVARVPGSAASTSR